MKLEKIKKNELKEIPKKEMIGREHLIEMNSIFKKTLIFPVFLDGKELDSSKTDIYVEQNGVIYEMKSGKTKERFIHKYSKRIREETDRYHGN
jgi:hypothetical protein